VSLVESGFAWLPAFLWRFDKGWRGLRREVPWTRRLPSAYVRDHVRVALQPVDGPPDAGELLRVIDQLGSDELLMFSSDYPHRHSAEDLAAMPAGLSPALTDRLLAANARDHYRL
jgi:predicted TIM-barrel fold metal-dependent hydrolase